MKELYYEDVHQTEFEATVTECIYDPKNQIYKVVLDQTAFFPEEGGQSADKGTLSFSPSNTSPKVTLPLLDAHKKEQVIYHYVKEEIPVGTLVTGKVDWEQRFDFMQQHTGEHIVSGLIHAACGYDNVGFHLGLQEVTLDFNGTLTLDELRVIEQKANQAIWENIPVEISYPRQDQLASMNYRSKLDLKENVRIVAIPGFDVCACCAPHVDSTGQIGILKITGVQSHRGGVRINILCGKRALRDYSLKQDSVSYISSALSVKPELVADGVDRLKEEARLQKETMYQLQSKLLTQLAATLPSPKEASHALLFTEPMNDIAIRNLINDLAPKYSGYVGVFWGTDKDGYRYILGSSVLDCRQPAKILQEAFGAKGGGKAPMVQGTVVASQEKIFSVLSPCIGV